MVRGGGQDRPHPFEVRANTPLSSFAPRAALGGEGGAADRGRGTGRRGRRAVPCRAVPEGVAGGGGGQVGGGPSLVLHVDRHRATPTGAQAKANPPPQEPQGGSPHPGGPPPHPSPSSPRAAGPTARPGRAGVGGAAGARAPPRRPGPRSEPARGGCHRRSHDACSGMAPGAPHHPAVGRPRGASRPAGEARRGGGGSEPGEGPPARARGGSGPRPLTSSLRGGLGCLPLSPRPPGC